MTKRRGPRMLARLNRQGTGLHKSHLKQLDSSKPGSEQAKHIEAAKLREQRRNQAARDRGLMITKVDGNEGRWVIRSKETGKLLLEFWNSEAKYMTGDGVIRPCPANVYAALDIAARLKEEIEG